MNKTLWEGWTDAAKSDLVSSVHRTNERHRPRAISGKSRLFPNFPGACKCEPGPDGVSGRAVLRLKCKSLWGVYGGVNGLSGLFNAPESGQTAAEVQERSPRVPAEAPWGGADTCWDAGSHTEIKKKKGFSQPGTNLEWMAITLWAPKMLLSSLTNVESAGSRRRGGQKPNTRRLEAPEDTHQVVNPNLELIQGTASISKWHSVAWS